MNIERLMILLPYDLRKKICELIELKATANEGYLIKVDDDIKAWIDYAFAYSKEIASTLEKKNFDIREIDLYFKKIILK